MATLGYWDIRGLAQPIRLLLEYCGAQYEEKRFSCSPAPLFDKKIWLDEKDKLPLDFPNLPYYIDEENDVFLTQSNAILRHIARKFNLEGTSNSQKDKLDLMAEQSMDFRNGFVRLCYSPNYENLKNDYAVTVEQTLTKFEKFLKHDWWTGDSITWIDFVMYELLDQHRIWKKELITDDTFPKINKFLQRFEALP